MPRVTVVEGDLLEQDVDVIVNAWNRNIIPWWLLLPQGVSGAIKKRAGTSPFKELSKFGAMPLGSAVMTTAGNLPYKGIIHVAGINLLWRATERSIRDSVVNAMKIVSQNGFSSIAFPLIGAGSGGFNQGKAQSILVDELGRCESDIVVKVAIFGKNASALTSRVPISCFEFVDARLFRVKFADPHSENAGISTLATTTLESLKHDGSQWFELGDLSDWFTQNFANRNPLNIPGPIYGAETDSCLTGPIFAANNVLVDKDGQEFVFKQASNADEFRDLLRAAWCECFRGYGSDGDQHWRLSTIREWWSRRFDLIGEVGVDYCKSEAIAKWKAALSGGAETYLRNYAFFVENGRAARVGEQLPTVE